jgi:hypothetical protein
MFSSTTLSKEGSALRWLPFAMELALNASSPAPVPQLEIRLGPATESSLSKSVGLPQPRQEARVVSNAGGFYRYTAAQARIWEDLYLKFGYEIRALAQKYSAQKDRNSIGD